MYLTLFGGCFVHKPAVITKKLSLVLLFIYLLAEISFNAFLLDVSANIKSDIDDYRVAELIGRSLSGVGVCLFVYKFLNFKIKSSVGLVRLFKPLVIVALWYSVFTGQKILIDHITSNSVSEERLKAFKSTLLSKVAQITDEFSNYKTSNIALRAYLPTLLYFDLVVKGTANNDIAELSTKAGEIGNAIYLPLHDSDLDVIRTNNNKELLSIYNDYQSSYSESQKAFNYLSNLGNKAWGELLVRYRALPELEKSLTSTAKVSLRKYGNTLSLSLMNIHDSSCDIESSKCGQIAMAEYASLVKGSVLDGSRLTDWLPIGGSKPISYRYSKKYYEAKFIDIALFQILGLKNIPKKLSDYVQLNAIQNKLKQSLGLKSINRPLVSKSDLIEALVSERCELSINKRACLMKPSSRKLTYEEFIADMDIDQECYMGVMKQSRETLMSCSKSSIVSFTESLKANVDDFEIGGRLYNEGINSYRAIISVPVSLSLSLILIAFTVLRLLVGISSLMFVSRNSSKVLAVMLVLMLFLQPSMINTKYDIGNNETSAAFRWITSLQPLVHLVGHELYVFFMPK